MLNFNDEPCRYWSDRDVYESLTKNPLSYLNFVFRSLISVSFGSVNHDTPPKQIFTDAVGDFRTMPSIVNRGESVSKIVKIIGTNNTQSIVPGKISVGKAFNIHPIENFVTDVFDANILSSARTGAIVNVAMAAIDGRSDKVTLVGCGNVGYFCAFYMCALQIADHMSFFDKDVSKAEKFVSGFSKLFPNMRFDVANDFNCDVIVCATTSTVPILYATNTDARIIISVGADTDYQRELDSSLFVCSNIFVDSLDSLRYGDCLASHMNSEHVTEFDKLIIEGCDVNQRNIFITTGNALFDNLTIEWMLANDQRV